MMAWIYRALLLFGVAIVYGQVYRFEFVSFDDPLVVTDNPHVQQGLTPEGVFWAFSNLDFANWMPITWLTHLLDWECWQDWAGGYHLQSVGWHALAVVLLFETIRLATGKVSASFLVAAIYALHPLHVESVVWIAERKGIVSSAFGMLSLLLYVLYSRQPGPDRMALVVVSLGLGLMAKPMLVTLPVVFLLLDRWPLERLGPGKMTMLTAVREKWPLFLLVVGFAPIAYFSQHQGEAISTWEGLPLLYRLQNADVSLITYLRRCFWPSDLTVFYPHPKDSLPPWVVAGSLVLLLTITLVMMRGERRRPWLPVGWLWYLVMIVPLSGLIPIGSHGMADRYSDLPLIGIYLGLVFELADRSKRWSLPGWLAPTISGVLLVSLGILSFRQALTWQSTESLFRHGLTVDPDNTMAHHELGMLAWKNGDASTAENHFQQAITADPSFALARFNRAGLWASQSKTEEAIAEYRAAGEWGYGPAWLAAAELLSSAGRHEEALEACDYAIARGASLSPVWTLRGYLLIALKRFPEAEKSLQSAISLDPRNPLARRHLAVASLQQGKLDTARLQFAWASSMDPSVADELEKLVEASQEQDPILLDMAAASLSEVEKFGVACRRMESALLLAAKQGRTDLIPGMQARLAAYLRDQNYIAFSLTQLPGR